MKTSFWLIFDQKYFAFVKSVSYKENVAFEPKVSSLVEDMSLAIR